MDTMQRLEVRGHARQQCETRGIPITAVMAVVERKLTNHDFRFDAAVFAGSVPDQGGLIGSNGDQVWAIVRESVVVTIMFRRSDQPATPQALRVARVYAKGQGA